MFASHRSAAHAYANIGLETGVAAASPHQLITMLFDGALAALNQAHQYMAKADIAAKGQAISKAIMIIDSGLRGGLNLNTGGELAQSLDALYSYMSQRLMQANLQNNPDLLDEVQHLLNELKSAWIAIGGQA